MSDTMLIGALRAPYRVNGEITTDPLLLAKLIDRAQQASDRIEADAERLSEMEKQIERFRKAGLDVREAAPHVLVERRDLLSGAAALRKAAAELRRYLAPETAFEDAAHNDVIEKFIGKAEDLEYEARKLEEEAMSPPRTLHERLRRYVLRYFEKSGATAFPTVREAAKTLKVKQGEITEIADEDPFMLTSWYTETPQLIGDHFVEMMEVPEAYYPEGAQK